jgi:uncharacterized LabA/DUF88 family protein
MPGHSVAPASPFGIHEDEKVCFFIDGANFYSLTRALDFNVDYRKLHDHFTENCRFIRGQYYTAVLEDKDNNDYNSIRPLLDYLSYNGYKVVTKPAKEHTDSTGRRRIKGNVEVEMTVHMLEAAKFSDHIVLFSSNGDFYEAVEAVQRHGVRVTVVSERSMTSDELRRVADNFVEIKNIGGVIEKDQDSDKPRSAVVAPRARATA